MAHWPNGPVLLGVVTFQKNSKTRLTHFMPLVLHLVCSKPGNRGPFSSEFSPPNKTPVAGAAICREGLGTEGPNREEWQFSVEFALLDKPTVGVV